MYQAPKGQTECENCGALLPAPDDQGARTCQYCGAHYQEQRPAAGAPPLAQPVINISTTFEPINADAVKTAGGCATGFGLIILLIIVASVVIPLYFVFKSTDAFNDMLNGVTGRSANNTTSSFAFLPGEPSGPAPYVLLTSRYDSGQSKVVHEVIKVDGKDRKAAWTSPALNATDQERPMLSDGTRLYLPDGRRIVALNLTDGALAWQAGLSDEFRTYRMERDCPGCFALVGTRVMAVSADGVLQAFDTTNGAPVWSKRFEDVNARVWSVNGLLLTIDGSGLDRTMTVLDPATGNQVSAFSPAYVEPGEQPNTFNRLGSGFQISPVPGAAAVDVAYGSSPTCVQRWDLATGTQTGGVLVDESFSLSDGGTLAMGDLTFAGGNQGAMIVNLATSTVVPVVADEGWEYQPIGFAGGRIAALGKSSRGTTKYAVAWFDPATGAKATETPFGTMQPAQGEWASGSTNADDRTDFVVFAITGDKLVLVNLKGEKKLEVSTVDPATGVATILAGNDVSTSDIIPEFGPAVWRADKALVRFGDDNLWTVDLSTGRVSFDFP